MIAHFPGARPREHFSQRHAKGWNGPKGCFHVCTVLVLSVACLLPISASGHDPSKSYLRLALHSSKLTGQWDIPLGDLETAVPLEENDGLVAAPSNAQINYAFSHLRILFDGKALTPRLAELRPVLETFSDGKYVQLNFLMEHISRPERIEIEYQLFFETNSLHRGLLYLDAFGNNQASSFSPEHSFQHFDFGVRSLAHQFRAFFREGLWHIWTGYDHILFLIALLLPSVLQREAAEWRGVDALRPALINVLRVITAFTVAHSLTLSLATCGVVKLPARLTEPAIAFSVALAAANNLKPLVRERGWVVAFVFGLLHGFGFASGLSNLGQTGGTIAVALLGFNLGVEMGQLALVSAFLPVAFGLRRTWLYQTPILRFGSTLVIFVAGAWCAERVLNIKFMPF